MIALHIGIGLAFLLLGLLMRYGNPFDLARQFHRILPVFKGISYEEIAVRRFVGESSIKLGSVVLMIAIVIAMDEDKQLVAIIAGWICFLLLTLYLLFMNDRFNLFLHMKNRNAHKDSNR